MASRDASHATYRKSVTSYTFWSMITHADSGDLWDDTSETVIACSRKGTRQSAKQLDESAKSL